LSFNGVTQCKDGVVCRKWHVYALLKDALDAKVRLKSPLYAKGKIFRTSVQHRESTVDGRRWFTAGYKNDDLRKIFYAEGKGRNKKGFQDASGVWWYPSFDDAELALVTCIASAHNAATGNDDSNQQDVVQEYETGGCSAQEKEEAIPLDHLCTNDCESDPSASAANWDSLEYDTLPGFEKNSVSDSETGPTEPLEECNASTYNRQASSGTGGDVLVSSLSSSSREVRGGAASQPSKDPDSSKSSSRTSSAQPSSSLQPGDRRAASKKEGTVVRKYGQLGDSHSAGRRTHEHPSRSDRGYERGDRSTTFREYPLSYRGDSASGRNPEGGERDRGSDAPSDRRAYRTARHESEHQGSRRHYSSEGDAFTAAYGASESSRAYPPAADHRHRATPGTESYQHHPEWWSERPPPQGSGATATSYHDHRFYSQHQYHQPQYDHYHPGYYRDATPATTSRSSSTTPTFTYADLPHKWERMPPHVLLRGYGGSSQHHVIYVDGDYYKWFGTSWICRGPTYPD
jgi:hypothetical protein